MTVPENMSGIAALLMQIVPLLLIAVVFYFMLIRPQQKQRKARAEMMKNMKVGDRVKTIGGIHGRIVELKDDVVTIETSRAKTQIVFDRNAISTVEGGSEETNADLQ
jgi:preprotein translocase subunit YajC